MKDLYEFLEPGDFIRESDEHTTPALQPPQWFSSAPRTGTQVQEKDFIFRRKVSTAEPPPDTSWLRDQFATAAMNAMLIRPQGLVQEGSIEFDDLAGFAYKMADAMMKTRQQP